MTDPHGRTALEPGRCTTHHHACQCREAVHREVADALRHALFELEHATPGRGAEMFFAVSDKGRAALKKYEKMYP